MSLKKRSRKTGITRGKRLAALRVGLALSVGLTELHAIPNAGYSEDLDVIEKGKKLFNTYCMACHDFESGTIGPALGTVTIEVERQWLFAFIKDPRAMIESGDERATKLFDTYKSIMPTFSLEDSDIEAVMAYMHAQKKRENDLQRAFGEDECLGRSNTQENSAFRTIFVDRDVCSSATE